MAVGLLAALLVSGLPLAAAPSLGAGAPTPLALPVGLSARSSALPFSLGALNVSAAGAPPAPASTSAATSAIPITPDPVPPPTSPTVMYFLNASQTCCVIANFTAPVGTWALVELRYNGQAVGGVYDSSFRAYIDQVQVLFGTTPEYGQWNVTQDVTPYVSLLNGMFNFTFLLSAATVGGYFLTTVSLWFYPVPAGSAPPTEPTAVVPLFHRVFVSLTTPTVSTVATVPSNAVNATLELWTYGFNPDEFWYAEKPAFRTLYVGVDGRALAAVTPFPFINTGGNDPFAWRPITAAYTISDRPYDLNLTGALGLLEGTHNFTANISGVTSGSDWLVGGALLIYTSPNAGAAALTSYAASLPLPATSSTSLRAQSTGSASYAYASRWTVGNATSTAATFLNVSFASLLLTPTAWSNLTLTDGWSLQGTWTDGRDASSWDDRATFTGDMDIGGTFVQTSSTGGGYPIYGNFTSQFLNARQEWNETTALVVTPGAGPTVVVDRDVDNLVLGGNNIYAGTEELTGPNAALLLSITLIESSTADELRLSTSGTGLPYLFDHLVAGSAYQPPGPSNAETVTTNRLLAPVASAVIATPSVLDLGSTLDLYVAETGGTPPYTYVYEGLPPGCDAANASALACRPTATGLYVVLVGVSDAAGRAAPSAATVVQVNAAPTVSIASNRSELEVGSTADLTAAVAGGTAPFTCSWTLPEFPTTSGGCGPAVSWTPQTTGAAVVNLTVVDATGRVSNASLLLTIQPPPQVSIWPRPSSALAVGEARPVVANVSGGVAPYSFVWFLNGALSQSGANGTWGLALALPGAYTLTVSVTDAEGGTATSAPVEFNVTTTSSPTGPGGSGGSSGPSNDFVLGLVLGAVLGVVPPVVVVLLLRNRRER